MNLAELYPGLRVEWLYESRRGYGYRQWVPAVVVRVGRRKVTIDAERHSGMEPKRVCVSPQNLRPGAKPVTLDEPTPEILHAAKLAVAAALDPEHPMPAPLAVDMLQDAGADDRTDAVYHLFRAVADHLSGLLGDAPAATPEDFFNDPAQMLMLARTTAAQCVATVRGQVIPTATRDDLTRILAGVPGLAATGVRWTVQRHALENWSGHLGRACDFLDGIVAVEAEETTPAVAGEHQEGDVR